MATPDAHANLAYSTVLTAPSPATSGTSLVVQSGDGAKFPAVPFNATVWPISQQPTTTNAEIVRVTNISTDTLTITRTQESTSARTIGVGDQIAATITKKTLTDIETLTVGGDLTGTLPNPTLAAVGSATGPLGTSTRTPAVTIDTKGRVTALTDQAIALTATGDATGTLPGALTLKNTGGGAAGPIGDATHSSAVTVDAQGRVTALSSVGITGLAESAVTNLVSDLALKAPLASPTFTGTPAAPTPSANDNSTKLATTAYVDTKTGLVLDSYASGRYYTSPATPLGVATFTFANANLHYCPVWVPHAVTAVKLAINVTIGGGAGSVHRLGLYASTATGQPGALILDAGTVATTGTGNITITISQAVAAGLYWVAVVQQGAPSPTASLSYYQATTFNVPPPGFTADSTFFQIGYVDTGSITGALPANATFAIQNNFMFAAIGI